MRPGHIVLFIPFLLLIACEIAPRPEQDHLTREGPPRESDRLVLVLAQMIDSIEAIPLTGDRDVDIVEEMIQHHKAALEMNAIVQLDGTDERVKAFAEDWSGTLKKEIALMEEFLRSHPPVHGRAPRGRPDMLHGLAEFEPTNDLDAAYRQLAEMHLLDGITLATRQKERGQHASMRKVAADMLRSSEKALNELEALSPAADPVTKL
jgi:hypothetical protein